METIKSLTEQVAAATGSKKAQLVLKNARIVNIFTQSVEEGDIAIEEGRIVGIGTYDGVRPERGLCLPGLFRWTYPH